MNRLKQAIKNTSIKKQFLCFLAAILVILILFCTVLTLAMNSAILQDNIDYAETMAQKFKGEIALTYKQMEGLFSQIQYNENFIALLKSSSYSNLDAGLINKSVAAMASVKMAHGAIIDVAFVNDLVHWSSFYTAADLVGFKEELKDSYGVSCLGIRFPSTKTNGQMANFVFGCNIYSDFKQIGTVIVSLDFKALQINLPTDSQTSTHFLLLDYKENFFSFNRSANLSTDILALSKDAVAQLKMQLDNRNTGADPEASQLKLTNHYAIQCDYIADANSFIISAVDIGKTQQGLSSVYQLFWGFLILFSLFLLFASFVIYINFIAPLNQFSHTMLHIRTQQLRQLEAPLELQGCAELQSLGSEFTAMLNSIHELNEKIVTASLDLYESELQKKTAEIAYLHSQINPHFLYNTLELIRAAAKSQDADLVDRITVSLGKILRYSIKGKPIVSLGQEIETIQAYMLIQESRFQNRFTTIYSIADNALDCPIFKMILQPIVENSVIHGLEPSSNGGLLYIGVKKEEQMLTITIRDNGVGIPPQKLGEINAALAANMYHAANGHIGLLNTNARIKLAYGDKSGIFVESAPADGTCVIMTIHLKNQ